MIKYINLIWCGYMLAICTSSLHQDKLGKEGYIDHVNEKWVSPNITVPMAVILVVIVFISAFLTIKKLKKEKEKLKRDVEEAYNHWD